MKSGCYLYINVVLKLVIVGIKGTRAPQGVFQLRNSKTQPSVVHMQCPIHVLTAGEPTEEELLRTNSINARPKCMQNGVNYLRQSGAVLSTLQQAILSNTSDIIGLFAGSSFISCQQISSSSSRAADGPQEAHSSCKVLPQDHKSARTAL